MANSSSEDETDTLLERPTRIQPYQFEPVRQDFERVPEHSVSFEAKPHAVFHGVCEIALTEVLATQSIARELVHCYTWGRLRIVTVRGNTVGRHS